jgi:Ribbon-helix-helix protein, copG family
VAHAEVKVRVPDQVKEALIVMAGMQGKSMSQATREAIDFWLQAQWDGVTRVGVYWYVPSAKAALLTGRGEEVW